jgi:tetratricopeptide (TPR) repeat protein
MPIWPFKRRPVEELSPEDLRARLIAAASGPGPKLRSLCEEYKHQVAANLELMRKIPDDMINDPASLERYVPLLLAVAQCLASECNAPELWNKICGTPDDNPLLVWDRWYNELSRRMESLEYDDLISEARSFIEQAMTLQGHAARQNEAFLQGRLGELLFHSGQVSEAIRPFQAALELCRENSDIEGQLAYLGNLMEAHRYLGNVPEAASTGEELVGLYKQQGIDSGPLSKRVRMIRSGEPSCRIICVREGEESELDEISGLSDGRYEFQFRRNRLSLQKATTLGPPIPGRRVPVGVGGLRQGTGIIRGGRAGCAGLVPLPERQVAGRVARRRDHLRRGVSSPACPGGRRVGEHGGDPARQAGRREIPRLRPVLSGTWRPPA